MKPINKSKYVVAAGVKYFVLISGIAIVISIFFGCKKFVEISPAPNLIVTAQVFSDSSDANSAVVALYVNMMGSPTSFSTFNGNVTLYGGLSSDELNSTTGNPSEDAAYVNGLQSSTSIVSTFWSDCYTVIYKANAIINGLAGSAGMSATAKNQFLGEAKTIRAFCYFNLVNLYGSVPLVTTINYQSNAVMPRTSVDSVYQQVIADLVSADSLLPANYPTTGRVRVNKYAADALLARVYLYRQQWGNALTFSSNIINSGIYSLATPLTNVFKSGSNEAILQLLQPTAGFETTEGYVFVPKTTGVIPSYVVNSFLLSAFEPNDQRLVSWLDSNVVNGKVYYYPYKYKLGGNTNTTELEDYMIFRLAEQYLIRAEAEAEGAGNGVGAGIADLNVIRARAGLGPVFPASSSELLVDIMHERQVELFCEWGNRWYDLKRSGAVDSVMGGASGVCALKGGTWNLDWQLYPIYLTQLQANPFLVQNPGY